MFNLKKSIAVIVAALSMSVCAVGCGDDAPDTNLSDSKAEAALENLAGTWKTSNIVYGTPSTKIVVEPQYDGDVYVDLTNVWFGRGAGWVTFNDCTVPFFNRNGSNTGNTYYKGLLSYENSYGLEYSQYFYSNSSYTRVTMCTVIYK